MPAEPLAAAAAPSDDPLANVERVPVTLAIKRSLKRTHDMFAGNSDIRRPEDPSATEMLLRIKMHDEYEHVRDVPDQATDEALQGGVTKIPFLCPTAIEDATKEANTITHMLTDLTTGGSNGVGAGGKAKKEAATLGPLVPAAPAANPAEKVQIVPARARPEIPKPVWHPPWKLMRVISGHEGWVRCVAVDPTNEWFASSGNDRLIKIWDLASGTLKLSLTGHVSAVRDIAISDRHPYLFSASEDCEVKCWDLEQNMVIRNYHGHLSGVYCITLHPTLNILATGGRDSSVRVWDMRTKAGIFVLGGHTNAICSLVAQASEPQLISGSMDRQVRLWDLAAGKSAVTLTNHKKSIRAMALHPTEYTFVSCASDNNKVWKMPKGNFERNIQGHNAIVNACAVRENAQGSSILIGGTDNGYLHFWDWRSGHKFQSYQCIPQPGSMSAENGIFDLKLDQSGSRLITAECDKTVKIYREDPNATPDSHPLNYKAPKVNSESRY
jgi:pleiotropic regulator 1